MLVPILKNKGDMQNCSSYRGINNELDVNACIDAIFTLRLLTEKLRELDCVFLGVERVYDGVMRQEVWSWVRKSGMAEKYGRLERQCLQMIL